MNVLLFNPISTSPGKQPLPISLLSLAAVLEGHDWELIDGNLDTDPAESIVARAGNARQGRTVLAVTVMLGPQLLQAVQVCRKVRRRAPHVVIVWGGYVPTGHPEVVATAPYVDFVIRSQGEGSFLDLLSVLERGGDLESVPNLTWKRGGSPVHNTVAPLWELDELPWLPYERVPMARYIQDNYLGQRTVLYNSSFGCPFECGFCAVVAMSRRRWVGRSPDRVAGEVAHLVDRYGIDAVQMTDMDFFISEPRAREIAAQLSPLHLTWWAMGRADLLSNYSDATLRLLRASGLRMIFTGAESGSSEVLTRMNKGGNASPDRTLDVARRLREHDIVPEFSFVVGCPPDPIEDMQLTFEFIRRVKAVNPASEIVLYIYTPVPLDGTLFDNAKSSGFAFPQTLDEWVSDAWRPMMLRRGDGLPWVSSRVRATARNFERVLNAYYPTVTDGRLTPARRRLLRAASGWRYRTRVYGAWYELRALQRLMRYQRPETTGF